MLLTLVSNIKISCVHIQVQCYPKTTGILPSGWRVLRPQSDMLIPFTTLAFLKGIQAKWQFGRNENECAKLQLWQQKICA